MRCFLNHLEQVEFQIVRFRDTPEDRVIRRLLPCLDLTQADARIPGCPTRQMLHAAAFSFDHPRTGRRLTFHADLPDDFKALLDHA